MITLMVDPKILMRSLAKKRPIFHSEADFQHAFAWELHQCFPGINIRLERPWNEGEKHNHLDIWADQDGCVLAVELKYKTNRLAVQVREEQFSLRDHSAHDCGRYDFLKDVLRLEKMAKSHRCFFGYAILLTNEPAYWKEPTIHGTADASFRLHQGRVIGGSLSWGYQTGTGTMAGREKQLFLEKQYFANWQDYSFITSRPSGRFRYLIMEVRWE